MSASSLARLLTLSDRRTELAGAEYERHRTEVDSLRRQRATLVEYAREYRLENMDQTTISVGFLERRHLFVTRLDQQIQELEFRVAKREQLLREKEMAFRSMRGSGLVLTGLQAQAAAGESLHAQQRDRLESEGLQAVKRQRSTLQACQFTSHVGVTDA